MKKFLIDGMIFMLLMFAFMGLTNSNETNVINNNVSSFDQNFNGNIDVEDGYVNGKVDENYKSNAFAEVSNYVSNKVVDAVNKGTNLLKKVLKSLLD